MREKPTLWLVVHTHWEGTVFKTWAEYLEDGFRIILNALNLIAAISGISLRAGPGVLR